MKQVLTGEQFIQKALNRLNQITAHKIEYKDANNISYNENVNDYYDKIIRVESKSNEAIYISDEILGLFMDLLLYQIVPEGVDISKHKLTYEIGDLTILAGLDETQDSEYKTELRLPIRFKL